jgi:AcrR family transcriptional regulator
VAASRDTRADRERLPRGRHSLSPAAVAAHQRSRLLAAAADVFYERGYLGTTSKVIVSSARVSSSAFYSQFEDVSDCLGAAFDVAAEALQKALAGGGRTARAKGRAAVPDVESLIAFARSEPRLANLLGTELAAAEREIAVRRRQLFLRLASRCRGGRADSLPGANPVGGELIAAAFVLGLPARKHEPSADADLPEQLGVLIGLGGERLW